MLNNHSYVMVFFLMVFSACSLRPPLPTPEVEIPEAWRVQLNQSMDDEFDRNWWKALNDPVLDALVVEASGNNRDLYIALARISQFAARLGISVSRLFPEINGNGQESKQKGSLATSPIPAVPGVPRITNNYQMFLNLSYEFDLFGRIRSANEAALADLLAQEATERGVLLTVISSVATTYIQLRQFDLELQVCRDTLLSRERSLQIAIDRYQGGLTSELEVKQATSARDGAAIQAVRTELLVQLQENLLSILVGRAPGPIERGNLLSDSNILPPAVPEGIPFDIIEQRPDLISAGYTLVATNARIGQARADFFPTISLTGALGSASLDLHQLLRSAAETWQYALLFFQPIFTGGRLISQVWLAEADQWQALYEYEQKILIALREVEDALITHQKSRELQLLQGEQVKVLTDYYNLAYMQYDEGEIDYLNVLDAERTLFIARLDYAAAQSNTFSSYINIYKALGGGWSIPAGE